MRSRRFPFIVGLPALLAFSGCGYVHIGRVPASVTTVIGDDKLMQENSGLRLEKKMLQQELALTRAQGDALRMAVENRAADGDTSKRLVDKLNETSRELASLRANYARLQGERNQAVALSGETNILKARLGAAEEKLATSLRGYTELQEEIGRLRGDVSRTRAENVTLGEQLKTMAGQNEQAQAALAQLNTELLAQKDARFVAENDVETLRSELKNVAPNSSVLAQLRAGTAGSARSFAAEQAAENITLKQHLAELRAKVDGLETERSRLQQQLAVLPGQPPAAELANIEARLADALRNASELRDENVRLKTGASGVQSLKDQLHEAQTRAVALSEENTRLKTRLAVAQRTVVPIDTARIDLSDPAPAIASGVNATLVAHVGGPRATTVDANASRVHTVTGGDTLAKISALYYGTPARWSDILAANRDELGETNNLVVGRPLRIP